MIMLLLYLAIGFIIALTVRASARWWFRPKWTPKEIPGLVAWWTADEGVKHFNANLPMGAIWDSVLTDLERRRVTKYFQEESKKIKHLP